MNQVWLLILAGITAWGIFHGKWVAPLLSQEKSSRNQITQLRGEIEANSLALREFRSARSLGVEAQAEFELFKSNRPAASAMVWFPKLIDEHFRRNGLDHPVIRFSTDSNDPQLPSLLRSYWAVDFPLRDQPGEIKKILRTLANFEQAEPYARVIQLATGGEQAPPEKRRASVTFSVLALE